MTEKTEKKAPVEEIETAPGEFQDVHMHSSDTPTRNLKPGDWHAPASNPGAAAMVPDHPLQPESLQSKGRGITSDKDLGNPPYDAGDPRATDAAPTGSGSPSNVGGVRSLEDRIKEESVKAAEADMKRAKELLQREGEMKASLATAAGAPPSTDQPTDEDIEVEDEDAEDEDVEEDVEEEDTTTGQKRTVKRAVKRPKLTKKSGRR